MIYAVTSCGSYIPDRTYSGSSTEEEFEGFENNNSGTEELWSLEGWPVQELSTASQADFLNEVEQDVILYMNMARTDPFGFSSDFIEPRLRFFSGNDYMESDDATILITREGAAAVEECAQEMVDTPPMLKLIPSEGISMASLDHAMDLSQSGESGHVGTDGSLFSERISRYGDWLRTVGEVISFGPDTGREIVITLLLDDGVQDRGHRRNILNPRFKLVGVAIEEHPDYGYVCVIDFAGGFRE